MPIRKASVAAVVFALTPALVSAQVCMGTAPFAAGPVRIGGIAQFTDGAKTLGGSAAFGATSGPFGELHASAVSFDELDESATIYGGQAGHSLGIGATKTVQLCPILSIEFVRGPTFDTGFGLFDVSGQSVGLGLSVGGVVAGSSASMDVVPFASLTYFNRRSKVTFGGSPETFRDEIGGFGVGVGFVVNKVVTIQPSALLPFGGGEDSEDPAYRIAILLNLGPRK